MDKLRKNFIDESEKLGIKLNSEQIGKFFIYLEEVLNVNKKFNLTAYKAAEEILQFLFLDSLTCFKTNCFKTKGLKLIDIGTGAGIPGIPLKITRPDLKLFLLESVQKKAKFLEEVVLKLDLKDTKILNQRAEILAQNKDFREFFDIATAKAVAPLRVLLEYSLPFLKIGGRLIAQKGPKAEVEIEDSKNALRILGGEIENMIKLDFFNRENTAVGFIRLKERNLVVIKKIKPTSLQYPRRAGVPPKNPL